MKKIATITMSLLSVAMLAGCSLFSSKKKVSAEKFSSALAGIKEYTYQTAIAKYSYVQKGTGYYKDLSNKETAIYEYRWNYNEWVAYDDSERAETIKSMLYSIRGKIATENESTTYYINPLTVVISTNISIYGVTYTGTETDTFDKYGYLTKVVLKEKEVYSKAVYSDKAGTATHNTTITVTYK